MSASLNNRGSFVKLSRPEMQLNFQTHGTGFPILILHGLFGSLDNWHTVSRRLAEQFQVFTLDLRNHGRSPHSDIMNFDVMADDIEEFLQTHHLPKSHLLGHSLGGKVAMRFALRDPDRVARLIVADMAPRAYSPSHLGIFKALRSLDLGSFQNRNEMDQALAPQIPEASVRQFLLKNVGRTDGGTFTWKLNLPAIETNYPALLVALNAVRPFTGPALFIRGGKSDYIQDTDREIILELFPQARFETIQSAGHWLHAEATDEFVRLVTEFLAM
jgi:esterase